MKLLSYTPYSLETHGPKESEQPLGSVVSFFRDAAHLDDVRINYAIDEIVIDIPHDESWSMETNITVKPGRENWYRCYQLARAIRHAVNGTVEGASVSLYIWHQCVMSAKRIHIPTDGAWIISAETQDPGGRYAVTVNT